MNGKISSLEAQISELKGQLHTAVQAGNEALDRAKKLESDRQAWKDNCSDQDEIIKEFEKRNKRLKDDYDIHIKALALRADKIEELKNEYEKLKDLSIDMANSIKFHVCNRDLLDRLEELLTKKDGK